MSESVQHPDKSGVEEHPSREAQSSGTVTRYQSLALLGSSLLAAVSTLLVTMIAQRALNGSELTEGYYYGYSAGDYARGGYGTHPCCS